MADRMQIRKEFLQLFLLVDFSASHSWYSFLYTFGNMSAYFCPCIPPYYKSKERLKGAGWKRDDVSML